MSQFDTNLDVKTVDTLEETDRKCPSCGAWNTMSEFKVQPETAVRGVLPAAPGGRRPNKPITLDQIDDSQEERFHSGIGELDRVLGGGAVHGSFVLVGGEPGIGKSTLLMQMCNEMCKAATVLYVSGEESLRQLKIRAKRLGVSSGNLYILAETDLDSIIAETDALEPRRSLALPTTTVRVMSLM